MNYSPVPMPPVGDPNRTQNQFITPMPPLPGTIPGMEPGPTTQPPSTDPLTIAPNPAQTGIADTVPQFGNIPLVTPSTSQNQGLAQWMSQYMQHTGFHGPTGMPVFTHGGKHYIPQLLPPDVSNPDVAPITGVHTGQGGYTGGARESNPNISTPPPLGGLGPAQQPGNVGQDYSHSIIGGEWQPWQVGPAPSDPNYNQPSDPTNYGDAQASIWQHIYNPAGLGEPNDPNYSGISDADPTNYETNGAPDENGIDPDTRDNASSSPGPVRPITAHGRGGGNSGLVGETATQRAWGDRNFTMSGGNSYYDAPTGSSHFNPGTGRYEMDHASQGFARNFAPEQQISDPFHFGQGSQDDEGHRMPTSAWQLHQLQRRAGIVNQSTPESRAWAAQHASTLQPWVTSGSVTSPNALAAAWRRIAGGG